jgi:polyhydroxyalkanoate synthesis regulator phasin
MQERLAPERFATDMINFVKSTTLNAWGNMALAQEQAEKVFAMVLEQGVNAQKEGIKFWQGWLDNNKKTRDEFSKMVGENFERAQEFFSPRREG